MTPPTTGLLLSLSILCAAMAWACSGGGGSDQPLTAPLPTHLDIEALSGDLSVTVPADLIVHAQQRSVQATAPDGSYRIYVGTDEGESLIKLAGPAKDDLAARGWTVAGEQYLESAIFVALERPAAREAPAERREIWWVQRGARYFSCEGIATSPGEARLGEELRTLCQSVRLAPVPEAQPSVPAPVDGAEKPL